MSDRELDARKRNPIFYRRWDRLIWRKADYTCIDPHLLNVHPADAYDLQFQKLNSDVVHMSKAQERKLDMAQQGLDNRDVMVDLETFRLRDPIIKHLKDVNEPIPVNDQVLIKSLYWLLGYVLWKVIKLLGMAYRDKKARDKAAIAKGDQELERKRTEEDIMNAMLMLNSKSPEVSFRYNFNFSVNNIRMQHAQLLRELGLRKLEPAESN